MVLMTTRPAPPPPDSANQTRDSEREPIACLNCGAGLDGAYCGACGQAASIGRLTFPRLVRNALGNLLSLDSAVIRTFHALATRPGAFARAYLLGRRRGYVGPLRYYLLVVALNVGAAALLRRPAVRPVRIEGGGSFWDENLLALQIGIVFAVLMLPLAALQRWLLYRPAGYSLAEHYAFTLYALAQSVLAVLALQLLLWPLGYDLGGNLDGAAWLAAFTAYLLWAGYSFFREPVWRVALKLLGAYAAMFVFLAVVGMVLRTVFGGA